MRDKDKKLMTTQVFFPFFFRQGVAAFALWFYLIISSLNYFACALTTTVNFTSLSAIAFFIA